MGALTVIKFCIEQYVYNIIIVCIYMYSPEHR